MTRNEALFLGAALFSGGALVWRGAVAGPIDPPAGPVAPSYRTLSEVEPRTPVQSLGGSSTGQYVISQPGSYYLAGPLGGTNAKDGIRITASNVTLDLAGFRMNGQGNGQDAIEIVGSVRNITIQNGSIADWQQAGVRIGDASGVVLRNLNIDIAAIGVVGPLVGPPRPRPGSGDNVTIRQTTGLAIDLGFIQGFRLTNVTCEQTGGIKLGGRSTLTDVIASEGFGTGIEVGEASVLSRCVAASNGEGGFIVGPGSMASECTALGNGGLSNFGLGFVVTDSCILSRCVARANGTLGGLGGVGYFLVGAGSRVESSTASANSGHGFWISASHCVLEGNSSVGNLKAGAAAGFYVGGAFGTRLERNDARSNDLGISLPLGTEGFVVVQNTTIGNTGGNLLLPNAPNAPNISGQSLTGNVLLQGASQSAWSNFVQP